MSINSLNYYILYRKRITNSIDDTLFNSISVLRDFKEIKAPPFCWCADPFPFTFNGKNYIFAEIATKLFRKGKLGYICLDDKRKKWSIVSKERFHMSFPNIFYYKNEIIMIPETSRDSSVSIYAASGDFMISKKHSLLTNVHAVDTCLIKNEFDYLFTYEKKQVNNIASLSMYSFENTHLLFSIIDENKELRPAGNIFYSNGDLIIPTQNCKKIYGGGIIFNRLYINQIKQDFSIEKSKSIEPSDIRKILNIKSVVGCHTYNFNNDIEVIDIIKKEFSLLGLVYKIKNKIFKKR